MDLAIQILTDPMTETVRPEAYEIAKRLNLYGFSAAEAARELTRDELVERFTREED